VIKSKIAALVADAFQEEEYFYEKGADVHSCGASERSESAA
jgi:hypothetical protein